MNPETTLTVDQAAEQIIEGLGEDVDFEREPENPDADESQRRPEGDQEDEGEGNESDDDEGGDEGDLEDGDENDDSDPAPHPEVSDETLVDIQIGDDTYEVNFAELRAGYLRNEELVARSNQLEQEHQARMEKLEEKEQELLDELLAASAIVRSDTSRYDKINWEALKQQDPDAYSKLRVEALEAKEQAAALEQRRQNLAAIQRKHQEVRFEVYRNHQLDLATKLIPDFDKQETKQALAQYASEIGYTNEEIGSIVDARHLLLLHNAMKHSQSVVRKAEAKEKKVTKDLPPVLKPEQQRPQRNADRAREKSLHARFKRDKSVESAAALLAASFDQ